MGADTYVGGPGADALWLTAHPGGIAITLDGSANDGNQGEGDNVGADIEEIQGTNGNDVFTGGPGDDSSWATAATTRSTAGRVPTN